MQYLFQKIHMVVASAFRIQELEQEYITFWVDICRIESPTEYKEGVDRVGEFIMNKARERGWQIEVQKQPVSGNCICITMNRQGSIGGAGHDWAEWAYLWSLVYSAKMHAAAAYCL